MAYWHPKAAIDIHAKIQNKLIILKMVERMSIYIGGSRDMAETRMSRGFPFKSSMIYGDRHHSFKRSIAHWYSTISGSTQLNNNKLNQII